MIGDDIIITVLAIKGNQLRLGFTAPQNIAVHREEVYQRIQAEKITNISQARSGNFPLRIERSPKCSIGVRLRLPTIESPQYRFGGDDEVQRVRALSRKPKLPRGSNHPMRRPYCRTLGANEKGFVEVVRRRAQKLHPKASR